jgi:hypothetical protein
LLLFFKKEESFFLSRRGAFFLARKKQRTFVCSREGRRVGGVFAARVDGAYGVPKFSCSNMRVSLH